MKGKPLGEWWTRPLASFAVAVALSATSAVGSGLESNLYAQPFTSHPKTSNADNNSDSNRVINATERRSAQNLSLQQRLDSANPGDILELTAGTYEGNITISKSLHLRGTGEVIISGNGKGRVITVDAVDVTLSGLTVQDSGIDLSIEDAGIFVTQRSTNAHIFNNHLRNNLIGIYLKGAPDALVEDNQVIGRSDLRVNERGNGIHLWNSPGSNVIGNEVRLGRDGIFVTTSKNNKFLDNHLSDLRFAIHYMYTNHSQVSGNVSRNNHIGYAIMYSHHLEVRNNISAGDRDHGLMLNYTNQSRFQSNQVKASEKSSAGPEKCVFIYNANFNQLLDNDFQRCHIGIHFTAGSQDNTVAGNTFVQNRTQVKYVGSRFLEWSDNDRGNYWSDNLGFDLDGDQISDRPYRPNDMVDQLVWRYPLSKLLLNSPAVELLRWSQSQFPAFYPGGITDSYPLMTQPLREHRSQ